ncbi:hypothetical protein BgiMline_012064 [Biomphalaria glabrata]|uniref:Uncharacterized protein LOC106052387 isoform X1 n=1 Tax=Biomphalaria glabrata TaxID=6526 RepID=A0A9U8DW04_BIOGL|nr:uncharacterized protein LOC106052387 isoform X1 [Biomphalaria glabrata]KAI8731038.1 hypothetical protein BgiMline_030663 [Biomphalaria glabrata]
MSLEKFWFLFGIFLLGTLSSLCVAEDCGGKRCRGSCCGDGLSECCLDSLNSFNSFTIKTYGEKEDHDLKVADNSSFEAHRRQFFILFIVLFCLSILICIIFGVLNYFYWERGRVVGGTTYFGYGPPPAYTTVSRPVQPRSPLATQYSTQYSEPTRYSS